VVKKRSWKYVYVREKMIPDFSLVKRGGKKITRPRVERTLGGYSHRMPSERRGYNLWGIGRKKKKNGRQGKDCVR